MFGQTATSSTASSPSSGRVFRYEVVGLRQNEEADKQGFPIRRSGSTFITVPYGRMNEEMQRISRLGGKIIGITPLVAEV